MWCVRQLARRSPTRRARPDQTTTSTAVQCSARRASRRPPYVYVRLVPPAGAPPRMRTTTTTLLSIGRPPQALLPRSHLLPVSLYCLLLVGFVQPSHHGPEHQPRVAVVVKTKKTARSSRSTAAEPASACMHVRATTTWLAPLQSLNRTLNAS